MPLPHPHGYEPPRQTCVDRRRVLLAGVILNLIAAGLLVMGRRAVTFRKDVTPWLPLRRPGLRVAPGADRALLLACLSTLLPVDSSNGWHRSSVLD